MGAPLLYISDGTEVLNLLSPTTGFHLDEWEPAIVQPKGGGVFASSPFADGRRKVLRAWDNALESPKLIVNHYDQDALIADTQKLRRLLLKADNYFLTNGVSGAPVYLGKRASCETNTSYALIYDWGIPGEGGNPFRKPFISDSFFVALEKFVLGLERGHWLENPPGQGTCVQTSNLQTDWYAWGAQLLANQGFETAGGGGADVFASWAETAGDGAIARDVGVFHSGAASCKLTAGPNRNTEVTQTVAVPAGATVEFSFWTRGDGTHPGRFAIYDVTHAAYAYLVTSTGIPGTAWSLVQLLYTLAPGCISARFEFWCPDTNGGIAYFDDSSVRVQGAARSVGRAATCLDEVFLANKHSPAQLTDIFHYDDSAGVWSGNLVGAALPFAFLPAVPAASDIVYFLIDEAVAGGGPFNSLALDIGTAAVNITSGAWEYWDGAAWSALTVRDNASVGAPFDQTGVKAVAWDPPDDWAVALVNGLRAWAVRFRVTAVGGGPTPPQQANRDIYTINRGYFEIAAAQVGGEIPALACAKYNDQGARAVGAGATGIVYGLRSVSRGAGFSAYVNLTDRGNPNNIAVITGGIGAFVDYPLAPAGRAVSVNPGAPTALTAGNAAQVIFNTTGKEFHGDFHLYLRTVQTGGAASDYYLSYSVRCVSMQVDSRLFYLSELGDPSTGEMALTDLGQVKLPPGLGPLNASEYPSTVAIWFGVGTDAAAPGHLYLLDLILIPIDECAGVITGADELYALPSVYAGRVMQSDSVYHPLVDHLARMVYAAIPAQIVGDWRSTQAGPFAWQPDEQQQLWALSFREGNLSFLHFTYSIQAFRNQRYLGMRGAG